MMAMYYRPCDLLLTATYYLLPLTTHCHLLLTAHRLPQVEAELVHYEETHGQTKKSALQRLGWSKVRLIDPGIPQQKSKRLEV